jgi:hypothetical protein
MRFSTHGLHRSLPSGQSNVSGNMWLLRKDTNDRGGGGRSGAVSWLFQPRCPGRLLNTSMSETAHGSRCRSRAREVSHLRSMFWGGTNLKNTTALDPDEKRDTRHLKYFNAFDQRQCLRHLHSSVSSTLSPKIIFLSATGSQRFVPTLEVS